MTILDLFKDDDFQKTYESIDSKYDVDELKIYSALSQVDVVVYMSCSLHKADIDFILSLPLVASYVVSYVSPGMLKVSVCLDYSKK